MELVPNAADVALKSSANRALYIGIVANLVDMGIKVLQSPTFADANIGWVQFALLGLTIAAAVLRVIKQESIATATEQRLAEEKAVTKTLEKVATSEGPPITPAAVEQIKREAAWQAQPVKEG